MAVVELGGGRRRPQDVIDHRVGISDIPPLGARVEKGQPIAVVHAATPDDAARAVATVSSAFSVSSVPVATTSIIHGRVGKTL